MMPLIVLAASVAIMLAAIAIKRSALIAAILAGAGLLTALAVMPASLPLPPAWPALFDGGPSVLGFQALILASAFLILLLAYSYWQTAPGLPREEFFLLLLISSLGACVLAAAASFITLFLGLETMTLAMLGMIAYPRDRADAAEAH